MRQKIYNIFFNFNKSCENQVNKMSKLYNSNNKFKKIIAHCIYLKIRKKYGIDIHVASKIKRIIIPHPVGIVIGQTAELGNNVKIFPNVVIGAKYSPSCENPVQRRHAKIGDNVTIGAGSIIIGDIIIGNNVTIGAGSIINKNIPDNSIVIEHNKIIGNKEK